MAETTITIVERIAAPPEQVWATIADTRRYAEWVVNTLKVTRADANVAAEGVTYAERNRIAGPLTGTSRWRVASAEAPRHTVHTGEGIWLAGAMRLEMTVEPAGGGTRYTHRFAYVPGLGPLGPLVNAALRPSIGRDMRRSVTRLRELCEREAAGGVVTAVSRSAIHEFSKGNEERIRLLAGLGVEGDTHQGETVQHRSRVARDPDQPNLRQVHLMHGELHDELAAQGYAVTAGALGENVTTRGVDLLGLPTGTRLTLGREAVVEVTGLRNPCAQLDRFQQGLMAAVLGREEDGKLVRKSGVMAIVLRSGEVAPGDSIAVELPPPPHAPLEAV